MTANIVYLSKRNLLTLLSKVERFEAGEETRCAIIKHANVLDPYCLRLNGEEEIMVVAVPDDSYYTNRNPGVVHPLDTPSE